MNKKEKEQIKAIDKARRAEGLGRIAVGFDYPNAIRSLLREKYKPEEIAPLLGYSSKTMIYKIRDKATIPNHPAGEALWGLCIDVFTEPEVKRRFLTEAQRVGGKQPLAARKTHRIR